MKKLRFKPRATFNADLKRLASLDKSIIDEVRLVSFLDSPEALAAKKEAETGQVKNIGSLTDFEDWIDKLDAN